MAENKNRLAMWYAQMRYAYSQRFDGSKDNSRLLIGAEGMTSGFARLEPASNVWDLCAWTALLPKHNCEMVTMKEGPNAYTIFEYTPTEEYLAGDDDQNDEPREPARVRFQIDEAVNPCAASFVPASGPAPAAPQQPTTAIEHQSNITWKVVASAVCICVVAYVVANVQNLLTAWK